MAFCRGGALPQTIKQMQQRMLELKKTLQKELVSGPLLPAAHALLPLCSSCLMTLPPQGTARGLWEVRLVGQWPCHLERAPGKWLCDPRHEPSFSEPVCCLRGQ